LPNRTYQGELLKPPSCCCTTTTSTAPPKGWNGAETVYTLREIRLPTFPTAYILPTADELPGRADHQTHHLGARGVRPNTPILSLLRQSKKKKK
jgi:hypothetical protein